MYLINLWDSHPGEEGSACHASMEVSTLEEAIDIFNFPWCYFDGGQYKTATHTIEVDGPIANMTKFNRDYKLIRVDPRAWWQEYYAELDSMN